MSGGGGQCLESQFILFLLSFFFLVRCVCTRQHTKTGMGSTWNHAICSNYVSKWFPRSEFSCEICIEKSFMLLYKALELK
uniref:Uncharacterized protein n=1 Tax=Arundo donax TaxID=35708 RepID=A0A0A9FPS3_ARUDO